MTRDVRKGLLADVSLRVHDRSAVHTVESLATLLELSIAERVSTDKIVRCTGEFACLDDGPFGLDSVMSFELIADVERRLDFDRHLETLNFHRL
jgi:hypothetical protein